MRKIETKEQIEKREKKRQIVLSLILVFLLLMSTAGWAINSFSKPSQKIIEYHGFEFIAENGVWLTSNFGKTFGFIYLPTELNDVKINISHNINRYIDQPLYYTSKAEGMYELSKNLQGVVSRFQEACLDDCELNLPIKNCSTDLVIVFNEGDENWVYEDEKCIYIVGDSVMGVDKYLYEILDI